MPAQVVSPVATGGYGTDFERDVVAWAAVHLLRDQPILTGESFVSEQLNVQTRIDGWFLDDIVLETSGQDGRQSRIAVTVKSNPSFSTTHWPADVLKPVWEQYLSRTNSGFDADHDYLCLIAGDLDDGIYRNLRRLIELARECEPADFVNRMGADTAFCKAEVRALWSAAACPLPDVTVGLSDQARMLSRLRLIQLDFRDDHSKSKQEVLRMCSDALVEPTPLAAENLWLQIRNMVCEIEPVSGGLTRSKLLERLRPRFQLKAAPYFEADFERLARDSNALCSQLRRHTGPNRISIPRNDLLSQLHSAFETADIVFAMGRSGTGKSSICAEINAGFLWWLSADQLRHSTLSEFESHLGIKTRVDRLLPSVPYTSAKICIDGLDRCLAEDQNVWDTLAALFRILFSPCNRGAWKVILPVQPSTVDSIVSELGRRNLELNSLIVEVPNWTPEDWQTITRHYPWIESSAQRSGAADFFRVPKMTDWLVNQGESVFQSSSGASKPLIECLWFELIVCAGNPSLIDQRHRTRLLPEWAANMADTGKWSLGLATLSDDQLSIVESLRAHEVFRVSDQEISFAHDLAADWSRAVFLSRMESPVEGLAARETLPHWHRAIRLWSSGILDGARADPCQITLWMSLLESLRQQSLIRVGDLWVEGIIHSHSPVAALESLKTRRDFDTLLQRLLIIFEVSGTVASPVSWPFDPAQVPAEVMSVLARASRRPSGTAWNGLFSFLQGNSRTLSPESAVGVCRLAKIWLTSKLDCANNDGTTRSIADCVLAIAERFVREDRMHYAEGKTVVEAIGFAVEYHPERVKAVFRQLAGLDPIAASPTDEPPTSRRRRRRVADDDENHVEPWPDGARWRVNETFAKACLAGDALIKVAVVDTDFAFQLIYAMLIEDVGEKAYRLENERSRMHETMFPDCSLSFRRYLYPQEDNFLIRLLSVTSPLEVLRLAIRLTEFVTTRWHELFNRSMTSEMAVIIPASTTGREWMSFPMLRRFNWDDLPHPVDKILRAVLASWNHRLSGGADVSAELELVLSESTSSAFLDLLVTIGVLHPSLFSGPLLHIVTCPFLCQRHADLLRSLRSLVKASPEYRPLLDSTVTWWQTEARRREWNEESIDRLECWRSLALADEVDEAKWNQFLGIETPDPISVENCLQVLLAPQAMLVRGLADPSRDMLIERLALEEHLVMHEGEENDESTPHDLNEPKRCAAAATLLLAALGPTEIPSEILPRCRTILLPNAQAASAQPNGFFTAYNYGLFGQENYRREEATARGITAYALAALLATFPDDLEVRSAYARTMFAQEIIFTDMMWRTINWLGERLGDDYIRSLHLVLRVAAVREGGRCLGGFMRDTASQKEATKLAADLRIDMLCNEFANQALSPSIPKWSEIIAAECDPIRAIWAEALEPWERRNSGGFDTYLMNHSQPQFCRGADGRLDPPFVTWWERCAEFIHDREINDARTRSHERWTEHHFGSWIQSLAKITLLIGDAESSRQIWEPILSLTPTKLENVTEFFNYWWQEAISKAATEEVVAGFVNGFVGTLRDSVPFTNSELGYFAVELWTAALGLQDEFRALSSRPSSVRCPPALLAEFGPILLATHRDSPIRGLAHYLSLGFSGISDADTLRWFADEVTKGSYAAGHAETAQVLLAMLVAAKNRDFANAQRPQFRQLLNTLASHPWPDAVRFQEELAVS